jgi:hypothetical protein
MARSVLPQYFKPFWQLSAMALEARRRIDAGIVKLVNLILAIDGRGLDCGCKG